MSVLVLDVNETLFSLDAVGHAFTRVGLEAAALPVWFARVLRDGFAATAAGQPVTFPELARHHLTVLGTETGTPLGIHELDRVIGAFDDVEAQPDVAVGLRRLHEAGLRMVAFTNGSAAVARRFLARAGLDDVVEATWDVADAGRWKPHRFAYRWVCDHLEVTPTEAAMVAVHPWDVAGAMRIGMRGVWVDRDAATWPAWLPSPDVRVTDLRALAPALPIAS